MTGGLRKPAGRQCGFRHHLALSSIVRLFHSVKVEFRGLMPLAYFHHRARTGSRPPPVAALALALTLPGNGGSAPDRRTGHQRRSAPGPRAPHTARGPPPGHQTRTRGPSAPEGGTRRPTDPHKGGPGRTPPGGGQSGGAAGTTDTHQAARDQTGRGGRRRARRPFGPTARGPPGPRSPRENAGAATAHHATGAGRIPMEPPSSLGGKGCTGQGGPATERGPGEPPE